MTKSIRTSSSSQDPMSLDVIWELWSSASVPTVGDNRRMTRLCYIPLFPIKVEVEVAFHLVPLLAVDS
jgi:hypothetical protein